MDTICHGTFPTVDTAPKPLGAGARTGGGGLSDLEVGAPCGVYEGFGRTDRRVWLSDPKLGVTFQTSSRSSRDNFWSPGALTRGVFSLRSFWTRDCHTQQAGVTSPSPPTDLLHVRELDRKEGIPEEWKGTQAVTLRVPGSLSLSDGFGPDGFRHIWCSSVSLDPWGPSPLPGLSRP